jgi:hypothetical protein
VPSLESKIASSLFGLRTSKLTTPLPVETVSGMLTYAPAALGVTVPTIVPAVGMLLNVIPVSDQLLLISWRTLIRFTLGSVINSRRVTDVVGLPKPATLNFRNDLMVRPSVVVRRRSAVAVPKFRSG